MAEEKEPERRKGPKGGVKHKPGRGHDTKSGPLKKRRFQKNAAKRRKETEDVAREQWQQYDQLPEEVKKLLGSKGKPKLPRPKDET